MSLKNGLYSWNDWRILLIVGMALLLLVWLFIAQPPILDYLDDPRR